jgi:hypothetical protein
MTKQEKKQLQKAQYIINIKGDLLFLLSYYKKLAEPHTRAVKRLLEKDIQERTNKLGREVFLYFAKYNGDAYMELSLSALRFRILLFLKSEHVFEDDVFNLLEDYFTLNEEIFENLNAVETEPVYSFNFKKNKEV